MISRNTLQLVVVLFLVGCGITEERNIDGMPSTGKDNGAISGDTTLRVRYEVLDTTVHLTIKNDTAYYKRGEMLLKKTFLSPKKILGGDSTNPHEVLDEAFLVANCLVVLRRVESMGHFCHVPDVKRVEIHTIIGDSIVITKNTNTFLGNHFSSPTGKWGVISNEAEGELYGYLFVRSDGSVVEKWISDSLYIEGQTYNAIFNKEDELVWSFLTNNNVPVLFSIYSDGSYQLKERPVQHSN